MKRLLLAFCLFLLSLSIFSHPWKPSHYVIIDTDGGIDDMRAISMLLASHDVRVLAVTVSPGALPAGTAYIKVRSLLNSYFHEGIKVGINRNTTYKSPSFPVALQALWGEEKGLDPDDAPGHLELITEIITAEKTKITFLNLGSMSTAWNAMNRIPAFSRQVKEFIWSADGTEDTKGFNYNIDKEASVKMLKQEIPVKIIRSFAGEFYAGGFIGELGTVSNPYGKRITAYFSSEHARKHAFSYSGTDEMVPIFLHYPDLFVIKLAYTVSDCSPSDAEALRNAYLKIIRGETVPENQVIREMPSDPSFYFEDVAPFVEEIIERHGHDEWVAGVLANEMHRHLGVYATIGVKMGIRAREYFCTGVDEFKAVSYAGSTQPLSCMNDGIQVSTGATPGHGLLTVINSENPSPSVEFTYLNRKIRLTLKPEIAQKISSELKEINFIYGLDSNIYWELVRKNAIRYWRDLDRHDIFELTEVQ